MLKIKTNSKYVKKSDIFVNNNKDYIKDAYKKGASCIITDKNCEKLEIPIIKVNDINKTLYEIYNTYYEEPLKDLKLIGITGTDGKTTTATMIKDLLNNFYNTAYMGTNGFIINNEKTTLKNTTPSIDVILKCASECKKNNMNYLVMETSSEGLLHNRCQYLKFKRVIVTNVTGDHLNAHKTFNNYLESKLKILTLLDKDGIALLNIDDKYYKLFKKKSNNKIITYGTNKKANFRIKNIIEEETNTTFQLINNKKTYNIKSPYIGKFNVYNLVCAIAILNSFNIEIEKILPLIKDLKPISGRNKFLNFGQDYKIILDYAHTLNATKEILTFANKTKKGNIITVVGCAGGREKEKRKDIGKIITDLSDKVIFTMDDPRYEKVTNIINDMTINVEKNNYETIINRKKAIKKALKIAKKDDTVLILGKGEDNYMAIKNKYKKYNDLKVISNYFKNEFTP